MSYICCFALKLLEQHMMEHITLQINFTKNHAKKLLYRLVFFEITLVLIYVANVLSKHQVIIIHRLFDLDKEMNIPTWFSCLQLFLIGILLLFLCRYHERKKPPTSLFVSLFGLIFIFLSLDEFSKIHENVTRILVKVEWIPRFHGNHGIWIFLYLILGMIIVLATFRNISAMFKHYRRESLIIFVGMVIFLFGAVGMEIIGYYLKSKKDLLFLYTAEVGIEEFCEMLGGSIILYGTILYSFLKVR